MSVSSLIEIDPEFKALIPPLSKEEYQQLEENILAEGCRDALVVWHSLKDNPQESGLFKCYGNEAGISNNGKHCQVRMGDGVWHCDACGYNPAPLEYDCILLDGHNRYEICKKHGIDFDITPIDCFDRQDALNWIINNQLGRRNLHPDQASYLRGKRYNGEKLTKADAGAIGGSSKDQNDPCLPESTADRLATEYKVSAPTIKRDGQYAAAVDTLASVGIDPQAVIAREPKSAVVALAKAMESAQEPPLFKSEQPTPKDRIIIEATEKVKNGTLTVLQAAKEIEKPHISNNSGNNEWYTPKEYTEAARAAMEGIDLDPASSEIANRNVRATKYFSISDNGLSKTWHGRVWMNPPYSSDLVGKFCSKLSEDYDAGTVTQACVLLNNATETKWFQALLKKAVAVCFPACRIRYLTESGEPANSPLQGQAIFYLGRDKNRFADSFSKFGHILYGDL